MDAVKQYELLKSGTVDLVSEKVLLDKLKSKKRLRVKLGVDPTSADIHLGHTVVLQKLRQFQDLGHQAVLIIGDYTALVGDPSGTQKTRPQLSLSEIKANAKTYFSQVKKVLNMKTVEVRYNGEWFRKMPFIEVIQLASQMTVARMLERDDFSKRFKKGVPICIHEFLYPLMQGYDSVAVKADVEIGGTDQLFNLLVGRQVQKEHKQPQQIVLTTPLIEGTDGIKKMSKSLNNAIGVNDAPQDMYGKIMSISDQLMWKFIEHLSTAPLDEKKKKQREASAGNLNPKDIKMALAEELVTRFHSQKAATTAAKEFKQIFESKKLPSKVEEVIISVKETHLLLSKVIVMSNCAQSHSEAKRLIKQGAVTFAGVRVKDVNAKIEVTGKKILKVGKRRFKKLIFKSI